MTPEPISLRVDHQSAADPGEGLFDFYAFADGRAVAVCVQETGSHVLVRLERDRMTRLAIDSNLAPGFDPRPAYFDRAVLCRVGAGFALVGPASAVRWATMDSEPRRFQRVDRFPRNQHGYTVAVSSGAVSDDDSAALMLLREPQIIFDVTRYALLRFDEADASCRWEWTNLDGDPPWLAKEDFPIPDMYRGSAELLATCRPILVHGDWRAGHLRLFTVGLYGNFERWGMDYSIHAEIEGGRAVVRWNAEEACFGTYSSSGRYLILTPLRLNGPARGESRLVDLETGQLHSVKLPRGFTKLQVADHAGRLFWLRSRRGEPLRFAIAHAE